VLGLAFKGGTDDIRESPAIAIINALLKEGAQIRTFDLAAMPKAKPLFENQAVTFADDPYHAATGCDALLILTEWKQFASLDLQRIRTLLRHPIVIDGRNLYPPDRVAAAGLIYHSVGRPVGVPGHMASSIADSDEGARVVTLPTARTLGVASPAGEARTV
jgi:UDPglucose 6-dehydrogenase